MQKYGMERNKNYLLNEKKKNHLLLSYQNTQQLWNIILLVSSAASN